MAVRSAKMIGKETGTIKTKIKVMIITLSAMMKLRFVVHFVNSHPPSLFIISIITKVQKIE